VQTLFPTLLLKGLLFQAVFNFLALKCDADLRRSIRPSNNEKQFYDMSGSESTIFRQINLAVDADVVCAVSIIFPTLATEAIATEVLSALRRAEIRKAFGAW
jgi:hypothetical protein